MAQISLAKALKIKKRILAEIKLSKEIVMRENSQIQPTTSTVDVKKEWIKLLSNIDKLVSIKTKIAQANAGIFHAILKMAELKGLIEFTQHINTTDGEQTESGYHTAAITKKYVAAIKMQDIDSMKTGIQTDLATLQDEIDDFNATTKIEWD